MSHGEVTIGLRSAWVSSNNVSAYDGSINSAKGCVCLPRSTGFARLGHKRFPTLFSGTLYRTSLWDYVRNGFSKAKYAMVYYPLRLYSAFI